MYVNEYYSCMHESTAHSPFILKEYGESGMPVGLVDAGVDMEAKRARYELCTGGARWCIVDGPVGEGRVAEPCSLVGVWSWPGMVQVQMEVELVLNNGSKWRDLQSRIARGLIGIHWSRERFRIPLWPPIALALQNDKETRGIYRVIVL